MAHTRTGSVVVDNPLDSRYELFLDGVMVGFADYHVDHHTVIFPHTVIEPSLRGQGLGARLVQGALDDVRASGRRVEPRCWYVDQFVREHPDYQDLLAA
jgi:predicted GNAT family acetyltransferase